MCYGKGSQRLLHQSPLHMSSHSITAACPPTFVLKETRTQKSPLLEALEMMVATVQPRLDARGAGLRQHSRAEFCRRTSPLVDWLCSRRSSHHDFPCAFCSVRAGPTRA